jgi:hypothetical protein
MFAAIRKLFRSHQIALRHKKEMLYEDISSPFIVEFKLI